MDKYGEVINMRERFEGCNPHEVILWAERFIREGEAVVAVNETVKAWPLDGAHAFMLAAKEMFGWTEARDGIVKTMFGNMKVSPTEVAVEVDYDVYEQVVWGGLALPGVDGELPCGVGEEDGMPCFVVQGKVKKKDVSKVRELMKLTRKVVKVNSIYRGKPLVLEPDKDGSILMSPPKFFKVNGLSKDDLILPEETFEAVNTAVFSQIEDMDAIKAAGLPCKRTVVLAGMPGTGKTLTMTIAAKLCKGVGRTFMLLKDIDFLEDAIKLATTYNLSPALISAEDIDRRMFQRDEGANRLLNAIDGVDSKNLDIVFLLTTNYRERLIDTFQRAGRSDWIITMPLPDTQAAAKLLQRYSNSEDFDMEPADYEEVGEILAAEETLPSNIAEVARRAQYYKIAQKKDKIDVGLMLNVAKQVVDEKRNPVKLEDKKNGVLEIMMQHTEKIGNVEKLLTGVAGRVGA